MTLRLKLTLLLVTMVVLFTVAQFAFHIRDTRASVHEETVAANVVATHLLGNLMGVFAHGNQAAVLPMLRGIGRVRSNELRLLDDQGNEIYRSPPSPYKAGREAPGWYAALVRPALERTELLMAGHVLEIEADPDRSVLDGWDQAVRQFQVAMLLLALGIGILWLLVRQTMRPFDRIVDGLRQMQKGHYAARLPVAGGAEAQAIARAFNGMAEAVQVTDLARREAAEARLRLEQNRELAQAVEARVDAERRHIARELHDESAQGLTAIRSLAQALAGDAARSDADVRRALALIGTTATQVQDAMHALVSRLRLGDPEPVDPGETLRARIGEWRSTHPGVDFALSMSDLPADLGERHALAVHRIVQEAVTNALRHGAPRRLLIEIAMSADRLTVQVDDDGSGLPDDWQSRGHFGVRGMRERARMLGGDLDIGPGRLGGVCVRAGWPWHGHGATSHG